MRATFAAADSRAARRAVARSLRDWGLILITDDVELVTAELANNAVNHGGGIASVQLEYDGDSLRLEVTDNNPQPPPGVLVERVQRPSAAVSGRGLHIAATVSRAWGWWSSPPGKVVWAELDVPPTLRTWPEGPRARH